MQGEPVCAIASPELRATPEPDRVFPAAARCLRSGLAIYCQSNVVRDFRRLLLRTLQAIQPVLREPGVLVVGSEVPNLLEAGARCAFAAGAAGADARPHAAPCAPARGVWNRLRRVLVDALQVWEIDDSDAGLLERRGCVALEVAHE